jgi:hypothetical protein
VRVTSRPFFGTFVAITHIGLIVALVVLTHRSRLAGLEQPVVATLVFLPDGTVPSSLPAPSALPGPTSARALTAPALAPRPEAQRPAAVPGNAITIDGWYDSASNAAAAQVEADEERRRQAGSMGQAAVAARSLAETPKKPGTDFAWSKAQTQRIERVDGATIVHISERCVLVNFLLAVCALGKEEPRGDLFKDMNKEPEFGDWKD